ncbi:MAG: hypothetical protein ACE37H_00690 [Phycisphaeraceae bacterium]
MLAPLVASAKLFSGYGDQVAKMAKRTGLSVETLSELRFVATQTGTEFESLEMAFRKMQRSIYDAGRGLSTQVDALSDLGLTFADLDGLSPEEQFKLLADRISMIEDPTRKAAIAMTLFGRTGTNLLPMFASGARGIEVLQAEARRLGLTMSGEDAAAAEEFTDALDRLWKVVKMGVFHIGAALAPTLQKVADTITALSVQVSAWMNENRTVIATVLKVVVAVIAVGVAITLLGTTISIFAGVLGAFITVITTVVLVIKTLGAVLLFLVSPIGIVIAAVAGLAAYLIYATDAGAKALSWLGQKFMVLKDDALKAYQGIADALAAGDIGLAVKVLWLTIKMEWTRGTNFLENMWLGFRGFFIQIGYDAWHGLLAIAEIVWHALEVGWIETTAFFAKAWQGFVGFFAATWERIKAGAKKAWNWIKSLFDDSIDLQAENQLVEDQKNAAIAQIEDDQQRRIAEREAQRQRERERARAIHEQTLAGIGQENLDRQQELEDEYAQRMSENEQDLQRAREEWQRAVDEARQKREEKESEDAGPGQLEDPDAIIDRARDALEGIGDVVDAEVAKVGVRGTFYAAGARGLSTGNAADRTAKATEETAKNTKRLAQAAVAGGVTFA